MERRPRRSASKQQAGLLLSGSALRAALDEERIFRRGSWAPSNIKGAGYELRLAKDWVAYPHSESDGGHRVLPAKGPVSQFRLEPGETAVIASAERFCLDFDITCSIGPKFRWAAEGLQVLHGSVAHPGYGRERNEDTGDWVRSDDVRLYVVVVNIGPEAITLTAGKPMLYVQFTAVEFVEPQEAVKNIGFDVLTERYMSGGSRQAQFYSTVGNLTDRADGLDSRLGLVEATVAKTSSLVELVVVFGVFLVAVTVLGVVYGGLTSTVGSMSASPAGWQLVAVIAMTVAFLGAATAVTVAVLRAVRRTMRSAAPPVPRGVIHRGEGQRSDS